MLIAKQLSILCIILSMCFLFCLVQAKADPLHDCPQLMLWAWERPENLMWINPAKVGVAYLDRTISLSGDSVSVHHRQQPLRVPPDTYMMSTVRIESDGGHLPKFSPAQVESITRAILAARGNSKIRAIQIDFDARKSERLEYRHLLEKVRTALPSGTALTMTALASWCAGDCWMDGLPVDEAVPMFFDMGVAQSRRTDYLDYLSPQSCVLSGHQMWCKCRGSIGISSEESIDRRLIANRRVYVFSPRAWANQPKISAVDFTRFQ